jgi:DNA-binding transcriptional LysR family regulator
MSIRSKTFDIELLRTFVTIVDKKGFGQAADTLKLTQSAISHHMRRLEDQIDRPVFRREGRNKVLTEDGDLLLNYARRILNLNDELFERISSSRNEVLNFGMPEYFADKLLPEILSYFHDTNTEIQLNVRVERNADIVAAVAVAEVDIAVVIGPIGIPSSDTISYESLVWLGHDVGYASHRPVPLVVFKAPCPFRQTAINTLDANGISWKVIHTASNFADMRAALRAKLGFTVLPRMVAEPGLSPQTGHSILPVLPKLEVKFLYPLDKPRENVRKLSATILAVWPTNTNPNF